MEVRIYMRNADLGRDVRVYGGVQDLLLADRARWSGGRNGASESKEDGRCGEEHECGCKGRKCEMN
jgi:hypothetical protein